MPNLLIHIVLKKNSQEANEDWDHLILWIVHTDCPAPYPFTAQGLLKCSSIKWAEQQEKIIPSHCHFHRSYSQACRHQWNRKVLLWKASSSQRFLPGRKDVHQLLIASATGLEKKKKEKDWLWMGCPWLPLTHLLQALNAMFISPHIGPSVESPRFIFVWIDRRDSR